MIEYMLDTDLAIYVMSGRRPVPVERFKREAGRIALSAIAYAELSFGVAKSQRRDTNRAVLEAFLEHLTVVPFGPDAAEHYGSLRAELERTGTPCGANDMLIGAHARALGLTLVTNNRREFDRMLGLKVENWLA